MDDLQDLVGCTISKIVLYYYDDGQKPIIINKNFNTFNLEDAGIKSDSYFSEMKFYFENRDKEKHTCHFYMHQDGEDGYIEKIYGDLSILIDIPIIRVREFYESQATLEDDIGTEVTLHRFETTKGYVDIIWYGYDIIYPDLRQVKYACEKISEDEDE